MLQRKREKGGGLLQSTQPWASVVHPYTMGARGSIIIPVLAVEDMEIVAFHIKWFTMNRGSNNITGASNACPLFSTSAHY